MTLRKGASNIAFKSPIANYGYTGRQFDSESGEYYYRARMYNPATGRFTSKDPKGFGGGDANLYRYVYNNPKRLSDPFGTDGVDFYSPLTDTFIAEFDGTIAGSEAAIVVGYVALPLAASSAAVAGPLALDLCMGNPAACSQAGVAFGEGFLVGISMADGGSSVVPPPAFNLTPVNLLAASAGAVVGVFSCGNH